MSERWSEAKLLRAMYLGSGEPLWICEVCGCKHDIIAHHIVNRKYHHPEYEVPELCALRCTTCEQECHTLYKDGNRPEECRRMAEYFKGTH